MGCAVGQSMLVTGVASGARCRYRHRAPVVWEEGCGWAFVTVEVLFVLHFVVLFLVGMGGADLD